MSEFKKGSIFDRWNEEKKLVEQNKKTKEELDFVVITNKEAKKWQKK